MLSRLITLKEQLVLVFVGAAILVGALALYIHNRTAVDSVEFEAVPSSGAVTLRSPVAPPEATPRTTPERPDGPNATHELTVAVSIVGPVRTPGFYRFTDDARIQDLLERAGGATADADLSDINLAARLLDGTTLTVPEKPDELPLDARGATIRRKPAPVPNPPQYTISGWNRESPPPPSATTSTSVGAASSTSSVINLNTATQAELETLPGIGPKLAESIINYRTDQPFNTVDDLMNVSGIGAKRLDAIRQFVVVH